MEKIILVIYGFLANILIYIADFLGGMVSAGAGLLFGVSILWSVLSIVLVLAAIQRNNGSYRFFVRLAVGAVWILFITHFAALQISDSTVMDHVSHLECEAAGAVLLLAVVFLIVNFLLDFGKGKVTVMLWMSEFLFAASVIRLWSYIKGTGSTPQYEKLMMAGKIADPIASFINSTGITGITLALKMILLCASLFITVYCLFKAKRLMPNEWKACVIGQCMAGISYMLYEVHDGIAWKMDWAFMVFLLFCTGWMINFIIFLYELLARNQEGCIGTLLIGVSGIFLSFAIIFAVDMTRKGGTDTSLDRVSEVMTWIYHSVPYGGYIDFEQEVFSLSVSAILITIVLTIGAVILIFSVLGKVLNYDETGAGMGVVWFRNCSLILVLPIVIYWSFSMYGNILGDAYSWVSLMIRSLAGIGMYLCISNMAPAFSKGFLGQLKLIIISTVSALLVSIFLVPAVFSLM